MPQYFFILGRNPELSLAELHAVLPPEYRTLACSCEVLVVECAELEVEKLMRRLGGTVKIGKVLSRNTYHVAHNTILETLGALWNKNKKFFFGLSAYALDNQAQLPSVHELRTIGMDIKRTLQEQGHKVRLVTSRERALASVIVKKEKLLSQGAELVLLYSSPSYLLGPIGPNRSDGFTPFFIGQTLAVQEFEEASIRDFGRPVREMKVGMLPIQLAKIIINLTQAPLNATILDPFCGFGTILAEARLMGYANLIGSDLEQKMVDATHKNLTWLFCDSRESQNSHQRLLASPVEQLSKHLPPRSVDTIVTEPYLGPSKSISNIQYLISELTKLYISAFREFSRVLKPNSRVVFILPSFKHGNTITKTSTTVLPQIKNLGFQPLSLLPKSISSFFILHSSFSILYSRPNQRVLREIFVFEFKPQT